MKIPLGVSPIKGNQCRVYMTLQKPYISIENNRMKMLIFIKNWIIGYCNSRVFIGLAIMVYEPLYHDLQSIRDLLGLFVFIVV